MIVGPLPVIAASFAAGTAAACLFTGLPFRPFLACALLSLAAACFMTIKNVRYGSVAVMSACFFAGMAGGGRLQQPGLSPDAQKLLGEGRGVLKGRVVSPPRESPFGVSVTVRAEGIILPDGVRPPEARASFPRKLRIFVSGAGRELVREGDLLLVKGLRSVTPKIPRNPDANGGKKDPRPILLAGRDNVLVYGEGGSFFQKARNRLSERLEKNLSERSALFIEGVVAGRGASLPSDVADPFRRCGLAHLLAVSGLHLSVIALFIMGILKWLVSRMPPVAGRFPAQWISFILSLPLVWLYALFTSLQPPVMRSAVMVTACQLALMAGRKARLPAALALAGLLLLLASPENVRSASFLLSFSAVAGIFLFSGTIKGFVERALFSVPAFAGGDRGHILKRAAVKTARFCVDIASVSAAATLATMPVTCFFFGKVPLAGIAANIAGVPLFSFIVLPLDILYSCMLLLTQRAPRFVSHAVDFVNGAFMAFARLCSRLGPVEVAPLEGTAAASLLCVSFFLFSAKKIRAGLLVAALSIPLLLGPQAWLRARNWFLTRNRLTAVFADVGQGDAVLVRTPDGRHILVDAGPPPGKGLQELLKAWASSGIDLFVVTHGHKDHYGGAEALLDGKIKVKELWVNPQGLEEELDPDYAGMIDELRGSGTRVVVGPRCAAPRRFGEVALQVLSPCEPEGYDPLLDWNNNSIVLHLRYGEAGFLMTGDLEFDGEDKIARWRETKKAAVIKVPHHGSAGASGPVITGWPGLKLAVISAGQGNKYGFPHGRVLEDYWSTGTEVLRVDRDGAWMVITDGRTLTVRDYKWKQTASLELSDR
jgi:competence protein ComEC